MVDSARGEHDGGPYVVDFKIGQFLDDFPMRESGRQ
jgi:hypothetical protein